MWWRRLVAVGLAVIGAVACCAPASAATPVADGLLAIQPIAGPGIVLTRPDGLGTHRICTDTTLCGAPIRPSFSPNGRGIVFTDRTTGAVGVVASDGTCLWCRLGTPLTTSTGSDASFRGNRELTLVRSQIHTVAGISLTREKASRPIGGRAAAIANATTGGLAVVRGRWIYARTGATGPVSRQVRGTAPSWSPTGRRLAFTHGGWIWTVPVGVGRSPHPTRITRGRDPVWAPAGSRIAFIAPGSRVATIGTAGRHRRFVRRLRGRSLSWQRRPGDPAPCSSAKGRIVARTSTSVLRRYAHQGELNWFGCLRLLGIERHISGGDIAEDTTLLTSGAVAGRFAATTDAFSSHYGDCQADANVFDDASGELGTGSSFYSCADQTDSIAVDSSGFAAWHEQTDLDETAAGVGLDSLACPSHRLCVGATPDGVVMTTADPSSIHSSWTPRKIASLQSLGPVQCPTATLCVIAAQEGASFGVFTSHDPAGGAATWAFTPLPVPPDTSIYSGGRLSCAGPSFCALVVAGQEGTPAYTSDAFLTSTDPAGGASAWHESTFAATHYPSGLSCASASFCALVDFDGDLETTGDPTADDPSWTRSSISADDSALDCPTGTLCVTTAAHRLYATTDPAAANPVWNLVQGPTGNDGPGWVDCSSAALCVAFDQGGSDAYTSTHPAQAGSWSASPLPAAPGDAESCTPAGQCVVAIQDGDRALYTADPTAGGGSYTTTPLALPPACLTVSTCYSEQLYVHDDAGTRVAASVPTGAGGRIAGIAMSGNATAVRWTIDGAPRSLQLH